MTIDRSLPTVAVDKETWERLLKARRLGYAAAERRLPCAPGLDNELTELLRNPGENLTLLIASQQGHEAWWPDWVAGSHP